MNKFLFRALAAVVLLLIAIIGFLYFSLNSIIKKSVETVGPRVTGVDVRLASALISPSSGSGNLSGLLIGNPPGYSTPSSIRVGSISVNLDKDSLLSNPVVINRIVIENPELTLEGTLRGNNLGKILDNLKNRESSGSNESQPTEREKARKFIVREVIISGTTLNAEGSALDQKMDKILSLPELHLVNIGNSGDGVSPAELSTQILTPLLESAIREGLNAFAKQGIQELQKHGMGELQKALPGLFK